MRTVLFTASTWSHIVNFHRPYLRAFHDLGWRVHVACGGEEQPIMEADRCIALPFEKKMTAPGNFRAQAILRHLMREEDYALICTHTSLAAFFTRRAAAGLQTPVVNMAHGYLFDDATPPLRRAILRGAERLTAPQTDLLLTMNAWDYEAAKKARWGRRVEKIPGIGVDFSRFSPLPHALGQERREELWGGEEAYVLLYAAEFSKRKNQSMLLRALPLLPQRVKLVLPGKGALLETCKALAKALGVEQRVAFPGQTSEMPLWYAAADAAVSASRSEGLPFNIMEAMYCGLPVVASAVKGHTDLIRDKESGLLYPFDEEEAFARQVLRLLEHPEDGDAMAHTAREEAAQYGLEQVLPQVMDAYLSAALS